MLDIISHFFILYPFFTFNKDTQFSNIAKFGMNLAVLGIASLATNMYLMDSSIIQSAGSQREQNLYEIFETVPQDFLQFNVSTLKRQYRDLSRKYHPDKNQDVDTTAKFMGLKSAYEILGDPERRIAYDVYGQTDFTQDDRMRQMIETRFKNETDQQAQWESYKKGQSGMKVFGEVIPYYFTWLLLTIYRIERSTTCYYIMISMIALVCYFEIQVRQKYGTGQYDYLFKLMYDYFPKNLTIGENMRLTRELFPLFFQFVLIFCDFTIDAKYELTEDEKEQKKLQDTFISDFCEKQEIVIKKLQEAVKQEGKLGKEQIDEIYDQVVSLDQTELQKMLYYRSEQKKATAPSWTIIGFLKKMLGVVMLFALLKMILFPTQYTPEEALIEEIDKKIQKVKTMSPRDFANLKLNDTELLKVSKAGGIREQQAEIKLILKMRKTAIKDEMKQKEKEGEKKVKDYFAEKIKGKKTNKEIFFSVKDDFYNFANNKGGYWSKLAEKVKARVEKMEQAEKEKQKVETFEQEQPTAADPEDELEIDLPQREEVQFEVDQDILDSIFGKEGEDEEDEEEEEEDENREGVKAKEEEMEEEEKEEKEKEKEMERVQEMDDEEEEDNDQEIEEEKVVKEEKKVEVKQEEKKQEEKKEEKEELKTENENSNEKEVEKEEVKTEVEKEEIQIQEEQTQEETEVKNEEIPIEKEEEKVEHEIESQIEKKDTQAEKDELNLAKDEPQIESEVKEEPIQIQTEELIIEKPQMESIDAEKLDQPKDHTHDEL